MDPVTLQAAKADAKRIYRPLKGQASALPSPLFIGHYGARNVVPENSREAGRYALSVGIKAVNYDFWVLRDGGIGVMHDQTVDRTTTGSGNITDLDSSAVQQLVARSTLYGPNWPNTSVPLGAQILAEFGNRIFLEIESKTQPGTAAATVALLLREGISPLTCRIATFTLTDIPTLVTGGYTACYLATAGNHAGLNPATIAATGATVIGLDATSADMTSQAAKNAEVARWHAAGFKVHMYTVLRRTEVWPWLIAGADSFAADDPQWADDANWTPLTTDPFASGNFFPGMIAPGGSASPTRGTFVGPVGYARWQQNQGGTNYNLIGPLCPIAGAIDTTTQAATLAGATSLIVGPQNKPLAGKLLTIDPPPGSITIVAAASGGAFAAGTYFYKVTAVGPSGETGPSREVSTAVVLNGTITVSGSLPDGATGVNVYRGTATGAQNTLVGAATITGTKSFTLTDTGGAGTAQAVPAGVTETVTPTQNATRNADGTYTVTVPALTYAHAAGVRVYGGTWTLATSITFDAMGSDTSRHPDIITGCRDDTKFNTGASATDTGFQSFLRATGAMATANILQGTSLGTAGSGTSTAISAPVTLSAGLTAGAAITSLPVTALATAVVAGQKFVLPTGQVAVASGSAAVSATAIPVTSITPYAAVVSGATLPQQVPVTVQRSQTQVTFTRVDTATSITVNTTDFFGGYLHFGRQDSNAGMLTSHSLSAIS